MLITIPASLLSKGYTYQSHLWPAKEKRKQSASPSVDYPSIKAYGNCFVSNWIFRNASYPAYPDAKFLFHYLIYEISIEFDRPADHNAPLTPIDSDCTAFRSSDSCNHTFRMTRLDIPLSFNAHQTIQLLPSLPRHLQVRITLSSSQKPSKGVKPASREKSNTSTIQGVSGRLECHLNLGGLEKTLLTSRVESSRNQFCQCRLVKERPIRGIRGEVDAQAEALDSTGYIYSFLGE